MMRFSGAALIALALLIAGCSIPQKNVVEHSSINLSKFQFADLDSVVLQQQRPIAVFIHSEWCKYCAAMSQTTLENSDVKQLLNENYYFVSFDGEEREQILFQDRVFNYQPTGRTSGTHELAVELGAIDGVLTYPAFVLLNPKYEIIFQHNAFLTDQELVKILIEGLEN